MQAKEQFVKSQYSKLNRIYCSINQLISYIKSVIAINNEDPSASQSDFKIFFLKMIIGQVQQSNKTPMEVKKPIDQWQPQDWQSCRRDIQTLQKHLKKQGLQNFIANLLKQKIDENIPLANEILLCGIAFLLGSNQTTQKTLIDQILSDVDNRVFRNLANLISNQENLFLRIQMTAILNLLMLKISKQLLLIIIFLLNRRKIEERYCRRKNVIQPTSTNQIIYHRQCIATYNKAFRFLQLLYENNNIINKNLIREHLILSILLQLLQTNLEHYLMQCVDQLQMFQFSYQNSLTK